MYFFNYLFYFFVFFLNFNLLSMEKVQELEHLNSQKKKKIESDNTRITTFKKNYALKTLLSTVPVVLLAGSNIYSLYKTKEIPLIDIISLGIHKASTYNQTLEKLVKTISFNNAIYWKNSSELFFTAPNILFLSTLATAYALPQVANRVFPDSKLNSTETNEIIKSTDPLVDYIEFFKHIPVRTTNITEFCLSIKETNHNINLSEEQKTEFAKEINNYYKLEALLYNLDFFTDSEKLKELINALENLKINNSNLFFEKNEIHNNQIEEIKAKVTTIKEKLTDENIKKIDLLEKLKIKQQQLKHIRMKEEEEIALDINKEEEIALDINKEEEIKKFLEIDYKNLQQDLKQTSSLVKKMTEELKEVYKSQTILFQEIPNLKNPHRELFEETWNGISQSQKQKIIKEIGMNEKSESLSSYALSKLSPGTKIDIESLYLEKNTEDFIKKNYKHDFKSRILYFIKSSLPGHKITKEIEQLEKQKIKTGMEYDIEIISKLPTAELKDIYQEKYFQHYTIENYKTLFSTAESIEAIDMLTLISLIKNNNFQILLINHLDTLNSELIIKLTTHSPFLLNLSDTYTKDYVKNKPKNKKFPYTEEQYKKFEVCLKNIAKLALTSDNVSKRLPIYLKLSLNTYLKQNPNENTQYWKENNPDENEDKKINQELLKYFNQQEKIKKHFIIPSKPEQKKQAL